MTPTADTPPARPDRRLHGEAWLAVGLLLFGLAVLPALIYLVGVFLLGAYGGGGHLGAFYGDYFRDLGSGSLRAWSLVAGPYVLVLLVRLVLTGRRTGSDTSGRPAAAAPASTRQAPRPPERREPTLKL